MTPRRDDAPATVRSNDPERASAEAARIFYPNRMRAGAGGFWIDLRAVELGPVTTGMIHMSPRSSVSVADFYGAYHVTLGIQGATQSRVGGRSLRIDPETAAVYAPDVGATLQGWSTGLEQMLMLKIDRPTLASLLRAMIGREVPDHVRFEPQLDLRRGLGAQWRRLAVLLGENLTRADASNPVWHPMTAARLSDAAVAGLLLASEHQYSDLLWVDRRKAPPAAISRAAEIINDRADEPLTVSRLAEEVGLSTRALHNGFVRHLDIAPGAYLTQVRLERAHQALRLGNPATVSATAVAAAWGFSNYGRFAAKYRQRYGQTPAQTLNAP